MEIEVESGWRLGARVEISQGYCCVRHWRHGLDVDHRFEDLGSLIEEKIDIFIFPFLCGDVVVVGRLPAVCC